MKWRPIVSSNPWLVPALAAVGIVVATITGGPIWGLFELYMLAFLGLVAFELNRRSRMARTSTTVKPVPFQATGQFAAEPWDRNGKPVVAATGTAGTRRSGDVVLKLVSELATLDPYPILAAFVAASRSDPELVRSALEPWIQEAPDPEKEKERKALLHYWLFRAGVESELASLKAMATENPNLAEVVLYYRLAVQDTGETWS